MRVKLFLGVFLVVLLSGCATAGRGRTVQLDELQNRVSNLETELQKKDQEIGALQSQLRGQGTGRLSSGKKEEAAATQLSVKQVQAALKNAGFYQGQIDARMGIKTIEAITSFQKANGLKADGIAGKRTQALLKKYLNK